IPEWPALGNLIAGCVPSLSVSEDLLGSMIRRMPLYVPVASVVAARFVVLPSPRSRRLIEALGVATVVHPFVLVSSVASASVGSEALASTRTTKTSTRATSEKGKGASVMRTVRSPLPAPVESLLHAAIPRVPSAMSAKSRSVLFISCLLHECVDNLRFDSDSRAERGPIVLDSGIAPGRHSSAVQSGRSRCFRFGEKKGGGFRRSPFSPSNPFSFSAVAVCSDPGWISLRHSPVFHQGVLP